jgi:hypothetical protein
MELWNCGHFTKYSFLNIKNIPRHPNHFSPYWGNNYSKLYGYPFLVVTHVVNFLKYVSEIDVTHQDVLIRFFLLSLETRKNDWFKHTLSFKSISSLATSIEEFLKRWALRTEKYEDILHDRKMDLQKEQLFSNPIEEDEESIDQQEF